MKKIERREGKVWVGFFHLWTTDANSQRVRTKKEKTLGPVSMPKHEAQEKLAEYTPNTITTRPSSSRSAEEGEHRVMTAAEVEIALGAVEPREKLLLHLAIFSGFRPGEMLALRRRHIGPEGRTVGVEQRIYNGKFDQPKEWEDTRSRGAAAQGRPAL